MRDSTPWRPNCIASLFARQTAPKRRNPVLKQGQCHERGMGRGLLRRGFGAILPASHLHSLHSRSHAISPSDEAKRLFRQSLTFTALWTVQGALSTVHLGPPPCSLGCLPAERRGRSATCSCAPIRLALTRKLDATTARRKSFHERLTSVPPSVKVGRPVRLRIGRVALTSKPRSRGGVTSDERQDSRGVFYRGMSTLKGFHSVPFHHRCQTFVSPSVSSAATMKTSSRFGPQLTTPGP
jgi:hypothetical protein